MPKKTISNLEVKRINRNQIYRFINRNNRVSKPEISAALRISMPTVLQNVNELIERGLVSEVGAFESTGGRKPKIISPIYDAKFAIGVDITNNHVGIALTDLSGELLKHTRLQKVFQNNEQYYIDLAQILHKFLLETKKPLDRFLGYGISIPGIVTSDNRFITRSHALNISDVLTEDFSKFIPYNCLFTNDANAAMIAEMYRSPENYDAIYLSLSNSVGGSLFFPKTSGYEWLPTYKTIFLGENFRGGEFGHMTLFPGGRECYCGKTGCVDSYCSAKQLSQYTDNKLELFFAQLENDKKLSSIWDEYLANLAIALNSLRMAFDCPIIVGGYVGSYIEPYLNNLKNKAEVLNTFEADASYIKPCHYKVEASALGAALRCMEKFIKNI